MVKTIYLYLLTTLVFFAFDMVWLGVISRDFYKSQLGYLMRTDINWTAAIIFYLLFLVGLLFFAVYPAIATGSIYKALLYGALFGFFTYATYDLTNYSTIRDWPLAVTLVDMSWGTILGGSVSMISFYISTFI